MQQNGRDISAVAAPRSSRRGDSNVGIKSRLNIALDRTDYALTRLKIRRAASFGDVLEQRNRYVYAGKLRRDLPQFRSYFGLTPYFPSSRNIPHDVTQPLPVKDGQIDRYQSEDVFEHVPLDALPAVIADIHRVLRPGGLFRLSLPDYNFDLYRDRTIRGAGGAFLFDPGGGGRLKSGKVIDGGHLWFPTISAVRELMESSPFQGNIRYLQYNDDDGGAVMNAVDYSLGHIQRSADNDPRVAGRPRPPSIVLDAVKRD